MASEDPPHPHSLTSPPCSRDGQVTGGSQACALTVCRTSIVSPLCQAPCCCCRQVRRGVRTERVNLGMGRSGKRATHCSTCTADLGVRRFCQGLTRGPYIAARALGGQAALVPCEEGKAALASGGRHSPGAVGESAAAAKLASAFWLAEHRVQREPEGLHGHGRSREGPLKCRPERGGDAWVWWFLVSPAGKMWRKSRPGAHLSAAKLKGGERGRPSTFCLPTRIPGGIASPAESARCGTLASSREASIRATQL